MGIRLAIIGCGLISQERHAPELAASRMAETAGFFDFDKERARMCASKYGGKVYESYEEVLADPSVDGVVICTANEAHVPMSLAALQRGLHVLCEKPVATTPEEAKMLAQAAGSSKGIFMAAHNQRYTLVHRKAKELLDSGVMGKVLSFRCTLTHQGPEHYGFGRNRNTWYLNAKNGLGCVTDLGIHKCDVLMYLLNEPFAWVSAYAGTLEKRDEDGNLIPVYDNAVAILRTPSGVMGTLNLSYTDCSGMDNATIYYCQKGVLRCQYHPDCTLEVIMENGEKIRYYNPTSGHINSGVMDAFVEAICSHKPSPVPAEEALRSMQVCFAIDEAARSGKVIQL